MQVCFSDVPRFEVSCPLVIVLVITRAVPASLLVLLYANFIFYSAATKVFNV